MGQTLAPNRQRGVVLSDGEPRVAEAGTKGFSIFPETHFLEQCDEIPIFPKRIAGTQAPQALMLSTDSFRPSARQQAAALAAFHL